LASALGDAQLSPMVLWFIDGGRTICFRQTIDMHRSDPQVFQALNNRRRRCRSCRNQTRGTIESMCSLGFDNRCRNNRCTTYMTDPFLFESVPDCVLPYRTQANMRRSSRSGTPCHSPTIAVEHRQCPQIFRCPIETVMLSIT